MTEEYVEKIEALARKRYSEIERLRIQVTELQIGIAHSRQEKS